MERLIQIYVLIDPRTCLVRYVGKSAQPDKRLFDHRCPGVRDTTRRANWIRSLLKLGLKPQLEILETVEGNGDAEERFYIALFRALGADLVNATAGGDGVEFTAEIRARLSDGISRAFKGKPKSPEHRDKLRAVLARSRPTSVQVAENNRRRKGRPASQATLRAAANARRFTRRGPDGRFE